VPWHEKKNEPFYKQGKGGAAGLITGSKRGKPRPPIWARRGRDPCLTFTRGEKSIKKKKEGRKRGRVRSAPERARKGKKKRAVWCEGEKKGRSRVRPSWKGGEGKNVG